MTGGNKSKATSVGSSGTFSGGGGIVKTSQRTSEMTSQQSKSGFSAATFSAPVAKQVAPLDPGLQKLLGNKIDEAPAYIPEKPGKKGSLGILKFVVFLLFLGVIGIAGYFGYHVPEIR